MGRSDRVTLLGILRSLLSNGPRTVASLVDPMCQYISPERALRGRRSTHYPEDSLADLIWKGRAAKILRIVRCSPGFDVEGKGPMAIITSVPISMGYLSVKQPRDLAPGESLLPDVRFCQNCGRPLTGLPGSRKHCKVECRRAYSARRGSERDKKRREAAKEVQGG